MRLLPLLLLLCLVVIAVEGGGRKKYCGKGGKGWCSKGQLCRPCHRGYCCRPPPPKKCYRVGQRCGHRLVCRYDSIGRLRCLRYITKRACQRTCYGYCRRCNIGYCCVRCGGKKGCRPCGKGRYCKG